MGRPRRPLLTREQIAVAALALLDEQGLSALGMRPLAARLGVSAPSLYHHVSGLVEVVHLVHDLVDAEIDLDCLDDADWRRGLEQFARSYRQAFLEHPDVLTAIARQVLVSPNALRVYEREVAALLRAGVPVEDAMTVAASIDYLVLGSTVDDFIGGVTHQHASYLKTFPHLARALAATDRRTVNDMGFETALALLLDDVAARLSVTAAV